MIENKPVPGNAITPDSSNNLLGIGYMVGGMFMLALMDAVAKWLVEENISPIQVLAVRSWIIVSIMMAVLLPLVWIPLSWSIGSIIFLLSLLAIGGHYALTTAVSSAQISAIAPFEYTSLIWATLLGYLVRLDVPSLQVWFGAAIIVASGLYVIYRESLHRGARL